MSKEIPLRRSEGREMGERGEGDGRRKRGSEEERKGEGERVWELVRYSKITFRFLERL